MAPRRTRPKTLAEAVTSEVDLLAKRARPVAESSLAALAGVMAREIDSPGNSATAKSMCAGRLIDALDRLHQMVPAEVERDGLDELQKRREARLVKPAKRAPRRAAK